MLYVNLSVHLCNIFDSLSLPAPSVHTSDKRTFILCCGSGSAWISIKLKDMIRIHIRIKLIGWIRIRIKVVSWSWIRIRIRVKGRIRIHISIIAKSRSGSASKLQAGSGSGSDPQHCPYSPYVPRLYKRNGRIIFLLPQFVSYLFILIVFCLYFWRYLTQLWKQTLPLGWLHVHLSRGTVPYHMAYLHLILPFYSFIIQFTSLWGTKNPTSSI